MDRALKERIIGAIVLVAVVVLVVPVFLDGPPAEGETVTERVPLPGQSDQKTQTVVLNRDRDAPVPSPAPEIVEARRLDSTPAAVRAEPETPAQTRTAVEDEPVPQAVRQETPTAQSPSPTVQRTTSSTGMWAVQLGSFSEQANAEKLAADLRKQGFAAFLSQVNVDSGQLHRVRIGPQKDREAAEAMAARLAAAGHSGQVVPHP